MAKHSMSNPSASKETSYKRPKIRESCTHCSSQKIRCTKERPACGRCVNKGLDCRYNISRRTGTRRQSIQGTPEPEHPKAAASPIANDGKSTTAPCDLSMADAFPSYNDDLWMVDSAFASNLDSTMQYLDLFNESDFDSGDNRDKMATEAHQIAPMSSREMEALFGVTAPSSREPDTTAQGSAASSPKAFHARGTRHHGHGCISTALAIISELHVSSSACTSSAPGLEDVRDFDQVLDGNRDALTRLGLVLDCCNDQEAVLTASYLAMQKALSWYAAALDVDTGVESSPLSDRVTSPPAFLGGYALDPEAQTLARAYVVMSQLEEHLHPLMAKLSSRRAPVSRVSSMTSLSSSTSTDSGSSSSAVVDSQKRALQETLDGIVARVEMIKRGSH